jgi:hypothetical protein
VTKWSHVKPRELRAGSPVGEDACHRAAKAGVVIRRGDIFLHGENAVDRVAAGEYHTVVLVVLEDGQSFDADALATEVRAVLGYGRMTPAIEDGLGAAVAALLTEQRIGEGPLGLRLRA